MTTADYLEQLEQDREDLIDNLETQGITGLSGNETFTELVPEVLNIESGSDYNVKADGSLQLDETGIRQCITEVNSLNMANRTNASQMFYLCISLEKVSLINTNNLTNCSNMFTQCYMLQELSKFDVSRVTNMQNMFSSCRSLNDTSLNNILEMCIEATRYNGTKTLSQLGFISAYYSVSRIQGLSKYQDFTNAGWTIGY